MTLCETHLVYRQLKDRQGTHCKATGLHRASVVVKCTQIHLCFIWANISQ